MASSAQLNIPLSFNQIIYLIKQLPKIEQAKLVTLLQQDDFEVPDWHKEIVEARIKTANNESFKPWSKIKKQLKHKK